ncbi:MAG: hypothetical protein JNJ73_15845 [Hyphomonadaceae bacterium]|nr:hypothetical protein [Hyphomonadaceae bacterium]
MRLFHTLAAAGIALVALAGSAFATPVAIAPAALSPDLQTKLTKEYGQREADYLRARIDRALGQALARVGGEPTAGAPFRIETTIVAARPNRPTFRQLSDTPGLDYMRSFGTGGAELTAVLRDAAGAPVGEVTHRYYSYDIRYVYANTTWHDAERAIQGFARKVANEYARVPH